MRRGGKIIPAAWAKPKPRASQKAPPRFCAYCGKRLKWGQMRREVDEVTGIIIFRHRKPCTGMPQRV